LLRMCAKHGDTPLHQAAKTGDIKRLSVLLPLLTPAAIDMEVHYPCVCVWWVVLCAKF